MWTSHDRIVLIPSTWLKVRATGGTSLTRNPLIATALLLISLGHAQTNRELTIRVPKTVDVCASAWTPEIALQVQRPEKLYGHVEWTIVSAPSGVRSTLFAGEKDTAKVYLRGFCNGPEADSEIVVAASIGDRKGQVKIALRRGQARVLLVDDDVGSNNEASPSKDLSPSDALYRKLLLDGDSLRSLSYDTVTVQKYLNGPALDVLQKYDAIIWYTAAEYGGNRDNTAILSNVDLNNLTAFFGERQIRRPILSWPHQQLSGVRQGRQSQRRTVDQDWARLSVRADGPKGHPRSHPSLQ